MSGTLRILDLVFAAGSRSGSAPLHLRPGNVIVLVGPNNSGKSLALREIENWFSSQTRSSRVINSVTADWPTDQGQAESLARAFETAVGPEYSAPPGHFWVRTPRFDQSGSVNQMTVNPEDLRSAAARQNTDLFRSVLGRLYCVRLDGRSRFLLTDEKPSGDLQERAQNHLQALMIDDAAREQVRKITEEAFGLHFVIDPTGLKTLRIRLSVRAPASTPEEQALDHTAREFHSRATLIDEMSDGVKAFVGLVSALVALPHRIMLIDEPEAFLHPPLANRLGQNLARLARARDASLVTATHSSDFLFGCLEATPDVTVVRTTFDHGIASARALLATELEPLRSDPLLRSTGVFRSLFHQVTIVGESDSDRAFYDEMNRRLVASGRGIPDALFLNAQNKSTVHRIVGPLRRLGIATAAIVDLDLIKRSDDWNALLNACLVPSSEIARLESERHYFNAIFRGFPLLQNQQQVVKRQGISALGTADQHRAQSLLSDLERYGLFLVPNGEVETWLPFLNISEHGSKWLVRVFNRVGQHDSDPNYLTPGQADVWAFLDRIGIWAKDPSRLGT